MGFDNVGAEFGVQRRTWVRLSAKVLLGKEDLQNVLPGRQDLLGRTYCGNWGWGGRNGGGLRVRGRVLG